MVSNDFQKFVSSCFPKTFGEWHDGLNTDALLNLSGVERQEAERLILKNVRKSGHSNHSVEAAGYLRLKSASSLLKRELVAARIWWAFTIFVFFMREYYSDRIVKLAWSLHQIENYPKSLDIIINQLQLSKIFHSKFDVFQIFAFYTLISFGDDPKAVNYLKDCLNYRPFDDMAMLALELIGQGERIPHSYSMSTEKFVEVERRAHEKIAYYRQTIFPK